MAGSNKGKRKQLNKEKSNRDKSKQIETSKSNLKDEAFVAPNCSSGTILDEDIASKLKMMNINCTQSFGHSNHNAAASFANPQVDPNSSKGLDFNSCKSIVGCPDDLSFEDWLQSISEEKKDDVIANLLKQIEDLDGQVEETKKWAKNKVVQAEKKLNNDILELRKLKSEKMEKEELKVPNLQLLKKKSELRMVNDKFDHANEVIRRLEAEKQAIQADIAAYNLDASESEKAMRQAQKKERKSNKKVADAEKKIGETKRQTKEEKKKVLEAKQKLAQVNEDIEHAKARVEQERRAKEEASAMLLEEKRLYQKEKEDSRQRLAYLKQELDMEHQRQMDHIQSLQVELSQLQQAQKKSSMMPSSSSNASNTHSSHCRKCIICENNEIGVLFLPCAHEVICLECNDDVYDVFQGHCAYCMALIQQRVKVYGPA